jgi:hypothetical protein
MTKPWTVQDAKTHLSEVLRRARAGEPQRIGLADACVVIAERDWAVAQASDLGAWLVASAPRGEDLPDVPRATGRPHPFSGDDEA